MMDETTAYDAIVVGAGMAGLAAAGTLVEEGRSVLVVERFDGDGGSTAMSGGWFAFSGTEEQERDGVSDDADTFVEDMRSTGGGRTDERLLRAYVERQDDAYRWLKSLGAHFGIVKISSGQSRARSHHVDIHGLTHLLRERIEGNEGGRMLSHSRARSLLVEDGRVAGVEVDTPEGTREFQARGGVILATGGFSRSSDLLERFAPEQLAGIPYGGRGCEGDGLVMAWRQGAGFRDLGYVAGTFGSHPLTGDEEHELLTAFYMGAIIVNLHGRRFTDESASYKTLGARALEQPEGLGFEIFDSIVRAKSLPGVPLNDIDHLEQKGRLFTADTLEELADLAGIDSDGLVQQVAAYNEAIASGDPDEFGRRGLVGDVGELVPVQHPPFYAYPAKTLMTSTYAGLTVTPSARVLRVDGSEIEGLWAAGELVGGFHGTAYLTGTALAKALIFGRAAAQDLVEALALPATVTVAS
ncbi:FAD-dependent oxidoreductase [Salinibacterium sp. SYSU T00001]|uniref:FAD-dependent oxidoreductase n=1 Tax=Homoserinimonas sedimenticola TaxID=2986805 RepID=UPI0022361D2C|nr:FAD-dependent oxidoreductase [Salinibacterium sedimenticola]MCW4385478.1 FAD-dependent oxidoreductase [Salinibacterium sedimenticola]